MNLDDSPSSLMIAPCGALNSLPRLMAIVLMAILLSVLAGSQYAVPILPPSPAVIDTMGMMSSY
jgi:hypothetical protein